MVLRLRVADWRRQLARVALHSVEDASRALQLRQTLRFAKSGDSSKAFFNHMLALPGAGLAVLANAQQKSIYVLHLTGKPWRYQR